jgi:hypothetical protein
MLLANRYQSITPEKLVEILSNRRHYGLAKSICEYLKLPIDRVLIHWACYQVRVSLEEEDLVSRQIFDKLSDESRISYAEVARVAFQAGRTKLATSLLEYESSSAEQVPLLLSMQQEELALTKSIESSDTDLGKINTKLVYLTIFHMKRKFSEPDFFRMISGKPLATSLLEVYLKKQDLVLLRDFYYQEDRRIDSGNLIFSQSFKEKAFFF